FLCAGIPVRRALGYGWRHGGWYRQVVSIERYPIIETMRGRVGVGWGVTVRNPGLLCQSSHQRRRVRDHRGRRIRGGRRWCAGPCTQGVSAARWALHLTQRFGHACQVLHDPPNDVPGIPVKRDKLRVVVVGFERIQYVVTKEQATEAGTVMEFRNQPGGD